ncbi:MAG TPA: hypothetical protein VHX16_12530 [Chloroflexota bacterium]|nr:hypothetical protein [Chloroflexota bacterium]
MTIVGQSQRVTQNRVAALFRDELGYRHMGDWSERSNKNIEEAYLAAWLRNRGYTGMQMEAQTSTATRLGVVCSTGRGSP